MQQLTSRRSTRIAFRSTVLVLAAGMLLVCSAGVAGAQSGKISRQPSPIDLAEGASQVVELRLAQPLLSPGPDAAYVTVQLASSDPSRLSVSDASVTWESAEWWQPREVTVTALADGVHNTADDVTVVGVVETNAPFYLDAVASFVVTIEDLDPVATTAPPTSSRPSTASSTPPSSAVGADGTGAPERGADQDSGEPATELAFTGARRTSPTLALVGAVSVLSGAMMLRTSRRRRTT